MKPDDDHNKFMETCRPALKYLLNCVASKYCPRQSIMDAAPTQVNVVAVSLVAGRQAERFSKVQQSLLRLSVAFLHTDIDAVHLYYDRIAISFDIVERS